MKNVLSLVSGAVSGLASGLGLIALLSACSGDAPVTTPTPTYHQEAALILDTYCTNCHKAGGIGPLTLTDYASAHAASAAMRTQLAAGLMPPWLPSDRGVELRYSRAMRPQDRDTLLKWIDSGATEGDAAAAPRITVPALEKVDAPRADVTLDPGLTYQPKMGPTDDYHCFPIGDAFTEDTYLTAGDIIPGNPAIVHHVIIYEIGAKDVAKLRQTDDAEAGPGYTCFGGPGVGSPQALLVWAPGSVPIRAPQGTTMRVAKGSVLVQQVHYNLAKYNGTGDHTVAHLERSASVPDTIVTLVPIANPDKLKIAANAADAQQTITVPVALALNALKLPSLTVYGDVPHMHTRGTQISTLVNGEPMVELPRWDFNWQQLYQFRQPMTLGQTDIITVNCHYNNTAQNQPVINGQRLPVKDVGWGENTTDEMCLSYLQIALPRATVASLSIPALLASQ